jgi:hypothetical protein
MHNEHKLFVKKALRIMEQNGFEKICLRAWPYELILEVSLNHVTDRAVFIANRGAGRGTFITEIRLDPLDVFICNRWGLFLLDSNGPDDVAFEEHTYVDDAYFKNDEASELEIFYKGDLRFVVNNAIITPGIRTDRFKRYQHVYERRKDGESGLQYLPAETCYTMMGIKNISFMLDLPRKANFKRSNVRWRLRLEGLLFQNANIIT